MSERFLRSRNIKAPPRTFADNLDLNHREEFSNSADWLKAKDDSCRKIRGEMSEKSLRLRRFWGGFYLSVPSLIFFLSWFLPINIIPILFFLVAMLIILATAWNSRSFFEANLEIMFFAIMGRKTQAFIESREREFSYAR